MLIYVDLVLASTQSPALYFYSHMETPQNFYRMRVHIRIPTNKCQSRHESSAVDRAWGPRKTEIIT